MNAARICRLVASVLTPHLLNPRWTKLATPGHRLSGHCYIAAESVYHAFKGRHSGLVPHLLTHAHWPAGLNPGETHWFLRGPRGGIIDPTASQFTRRIDYAAGRPCGFLTSRPSKRAQIVLSRCGL